MRAETPFVIQIVERTYYPLDASKLKSLEDVVAVLAAMSIALPAEGPAAKLAADYLDTEHPFKRQERIAVPANQAPRIVPCRKIPDLPQPE